MIYNYLKLPNGKILKSNIKPPSKIHIVRGLFNNKIYLDDNHRIRK